VLNGRAIVVFTCFFILILCSWQLEARTLYFYNPESNINDFRSLKRLFNRYLSSTIKKGKYRFQPFKSRNIFERFMKKPRKKNDVFLLSSWHYQKLMKQKAFSKFKPIVVATINAKPTYTKVLITKKNIRSMKQLQRKRIASASNIDYSKNTVQFIGAQRGLKPHTPFKILTVPKDIDALMSVLFGIAQGALISRESLSTFARINKSKYRQLRRQGESQAIMLPVVVAYQPISKKSTRRLLSAIKKMPFSSKSKEVLGLLGWDGWKNITKADMQLLEVK
jgi:hypothetical protein